MNKIAALAAPIAIKLTDIENYTENDETSKEVKVALNTHDWSGKIQLYKPFENELCFAGKILLRGDRMVIPEKLRERTLQLAHEGHPGMTVMKRRVRSKVWWPKIDQDVESIVRKCNGCLSTSTLSAPEPLKRTELPSKPWQHLAIDFMGPLHSGHNLLVVVDYYSRYIEIEIMKKIDSKATIKRLKVMFARFGFPISLTSDNGPQFVSEEFKNFGETHNIKLINTTPYWPQQNGEMERQNRSILKRLQISQSLQNDWVDDLQQYLLMYRSTPHSATLKTPSELLFGFNIRDNLPSINQPFERDEEAADNDKEKKEAGKQYADKRRHATESKIKEGDGVLVKRAIKTNELSSTFSPESCEVIKKKGSELTLQSDESGRIFKRNVAHVTRNHAKPKRFDDFIM